MNQHSASRLQKNNFISKNLDIFFFIFLFAIISDNKNVQVTLSSIAASGGILLLIRNWHLYFNEVKANRYLYIALGFSIPIGIAMIDTLLPEKRFSVFNTSLLYIFIGVLPIYVLEKGNNFKRLETLVVLGVLFIALDAVSQWLTGYHTLGYNPPLKDRVYGIFGEWAHISYFLATFSPAVFFYLYQKLSIKLSVINIIGAIIALLLLVVGIMLGGARAGFVSLLVSLFLFTAYLFYSGKIKHRLRFVLISLTLLIGFIVIASFIPEVQERYLRTTAAFGTDDFLNRFTTKRTNIWHVAFSEVPNYFINGVGTRGFNNLYQTYPDSYKLFVHIYHPHLHGLEVLIETGLIGFIPYIIICFYLLIKIFKAKAGNMWLIIGFVALMPINSHVAIYEHYWQPIIWIPIMIGLALAYRADKVQTTSHG